MRSRGVAWPRSAAARSGSGAPPASAAAAAAATNSHLLAFAPPSPRTIIFGIYLEPFILLFRCGWGDSSWADGGRRAALWRRGEACRREHKVPAPWRCQVLSATVAPPGPPYPTCCSPSTSPTPPCLQPDTPTPPYVQPVLFSTTNDGNEAAGERGRDAGRECGEQPTRFFAALVAMLLGSWWRAWWRCHQVVCCNYESWQECK